MTYFPKAYAIKLKNYDELISSSSGGAFTALSDYCLENDWAIACSIYNYSINRLEFKLITNAAERNMARGSKYIQSNSLDIYMDIYHWLSINPEKKVMFIGTGCQAEAFRNYSAIKRIGQNVLVVDLICHGVISPKIWNEYIKQFGNIEYLSFKDKRNGWKAPYAYVLTKKGKEHKIEDFTKIYYSSNALRPSCYVCPFAKCERNSDITIGDYWGVEKEYPDFYSEKGVSLVIVHSIQGEKWFNAIKEKVNYIECDIAKCLQPNLVMPTKKPDGRDTFWKQYNHKGIKRLMKDYSEESTIVRVKKKFVEKIKRV